MSRYQRSISNEERQAIYSILKSFDTLETFTRETTSTLSIVSILRSILGETGITVGPYEYPEPLQRNASILLERLNMQIAVEQEFEQSQPSPEREAGPAPKKRRQSRAKTPSSSRPLLTTDDPTFKSTMQGILIRGGSRRSYELDETYARREYKITGHNGLEIGQWWPLRICALRDGAHGAMQGGIAGSSATGAYSIVISSMLLILLSFSFLLCTASCTNDILFVGVELEGPNSYTRAIFQYMCP